MSINSGTRQNIAKDTEVIRNMTTEGAMHWIIEEAVVQVEEKDKERKRG